MAAARPPTHYLQRELYERIRSDPELFDFLQIGSLDGIWYWDLEDPDQEWMNARFWELLGYDAGEKAHLASEWQDLIFPEDLEVARENLEAHLADPRHPYDQIVRYRHKNSSTVWVRCRGIAIRDATGRAIRMLGAHNDVTALKRAEEEVLTLNASLERRVAERKQELERVYHEKLELQERLQEVQRLEGLATLAGGIAHDFNNLLTVILGNVRLALEKGSRDEDVRRRIESVRAAAEYAAQLTDQMLTYAGRKSVTLDPTDVSEVVDSIRELLEASAEGRGSLALFLAEGLPRVQANASQLRQVVLNLVSNAGQALEGSQGSIRIDTGTLVADPAFLADCVGNDLGPGRYVFLRVSDTGTGIDPAGRARLFEPFFSTKGTGRGFGLSVVLGIVKGYAGALKLTQTPGGGATFTVLLPPAPESSHAVDSRTERHVAAPRTVLVVDDDEGVLEVAEAFLRRAGFGVVVASDGRKAIEILCADPAAIDAVVLDLAMPELSGTATFGELRRLRPDLPVVLASGYREELAAQRFGREGLAGFLRKPYDPADLVAAVEDALARSAA